MRRIAVLLCAVTVTWALTDPLVYTVIANPIFCEYFEPSPIYRDHQHKCDKIQPANVIATTNGPVRGEEILGEIKYKAFKGIPYAAPPVGEQRFKAPQPPAKWTTVRDATKYGAIFSKMNFSLRMVMRYVWNIRNAFDTFFRYFFAQSEDCLSVNVFTTQLGENGLKPVLVYIHGGGFVMGDGTDTMYGPEFLVGKDIVLVTMNYRIGALGFLATNTSHATGNWGLKDQIAALKWVQENIAKFGGDPHKVTIYGASSGAASVQFHLISPLSKGLFHKAISASGSATCPWAINKHPDSMSKLLANFTGASPKDIEDPEKRVEYLRKVDARALIKASMSISDNEDNEYGIQSVIPFTPVVEPQGTEGAVIVEDPNKSLAAGRFARVPIMSGINSLEGGIMFMGFSKLRSSDDLKKFDINVCNILPEDLRNAIMARNDCKIVNKMFSDVYFAGKSTRTSPLEFTHLFGDLSMGYPTLLSHAAHARYATEENPAYFYNFTFDGKWNIFKDMFGVKLPGVLHGDDMHYIFKPSLLKLPDVPPTSPEYHTKVRMVDFITNFVKYGNPTPTKTALTPFSWEPSTGHELNSMYISSDLKMVKIAIEDRLELLDNLYKKYLGDSIAGSIRI